MSIASAARGTGSLALRTVLLLRQVREVRVPAHEATGPCKARALAAQLWDGEEFFLQVDAHMR